MNIPALALKNLRHRWSAQLLAFLLMLLSVALLWSVNQIRLQSEAAFERNLNGIDLVVGAKGSPLQLILSSVFHIDAPTGNIPYAEAGRIARMPMVKKAIPLAYGDYCKEFRIVGTNHEYPVLYGAKLRDGTLWSSAGEACLGAEVARVLGLKKGDRFSGQHGDGDAEEGHGEYLVCGIFDETGTVLDQLILCSVSSVWAVHDEAHGAHHHTGIEEDSAVHEHDQEITALLIQYRNKMAAIQLPRMINQRPQLQAAAPAIEINRLSYLMNSGTEGLRILALALLFLAAVSMLVQVWMGLQQRKKELALMRSYGYSRWYLVRLLITESAMVSLGAWLCGELAGRALLHYFSTELGFGAAYRFSIDQADRNDLILLLLPLLLSALCILSALGKIFRIGLNELLKEE